MEAQLTGDRPRHVSSSTTQTHFTSIELSDGYIVVMAEGAKPGTAGVGTILGVDQNSPYEEGQKILFDVAEGRAFEMDQVEYHMLHVKHIMGIVSAD